MFFVVRLYHYLATICICLTLSACNGVSTPTHCHNAMRGVIYSRGDCVIHTI